MNDKELLELAAKAAGVDGLIKGTADGAVWLFRDYNGPPWNPLTDDGDALRLAVELNIPVLPGKQWTTAYVDWLVGTPYSEPVKSDALSATRRAIVRAAAEIGRRM